MIYLRPRHILLRQAGWAGPLALCLLIALSLPTAASPVCATAHSVAASGLPYPNSTTTDLLTESWAAYRDRFILEDGRVVDWERADQHSTSEGQAYAMLRSVLIDDRDTFNKTLTWAENNLRQGNAGQPSQLWAWRWGEQPSGDWGILDPNFASDADVDAITALLLAADRWGCPAYAQLAQEKLAALWEQSTIALGGDRLLLPGPREAFFPEDDTLILNPSYFAPYAFRLFAEADPARDWMSLVDSSYRILEASSAVSRVGLPGDWVVYNPKRDRYKRVSRRSSLSSTYSFDAFRVWWRISLDAAWFNEPRALEYLETHSAHLRQLWRDQQAISAELSLRGRSLVDYEATAQYAMLYPALALVEPDLAAQVLDQKLMPAYQNGFWDNDSAYYTQNLAWFGLLPLQRPSFSADSPQPPS